MKSHHRRSVAFAIVTVGLVLGTASCAASVSLETSAASLVVPAGLASGTGIAVSGASANSTTTAVGPRAPSTSGDWESIKATLATLPVKGRAPKTGYSRDQFGPSWADVDHNGCDTRNDILARDLVNKTYKDGTRGCVVLTGTLNDEYTGKAIEFRRGQGTSNAVQIDHMVALSDAWQKGAQQLSSAQRARLANDPLNLIAVDGPANGQKSDGDAATWLPPNKAYRCTYVSRQVLVKAKYSLWVTQAEHDAIARVLDSCGTGSQAGAVPTPGPAAPLAPAPTAPTGEVYYKNCAAVRAAGAAPIHVGDPGYAKRLDRDGDGIGCE